MGYNIEFFGCFSIDTENLSEDKYYMMLQEFENFEQWALNKYPSLKEYGPMDWDLDFCNLTPKNVHRGQAHNWIPWLRAIVSFLRQYENDNLVIGGDSSDLINFRESCGDLTCGVFALLQDKISITTIESDGLRVTSHTKYYPLVVDDPVDVGA